MNTKDMVSYCNRGKYGLGKNKNKCIYNFDLLGTTRKKLF
jgi:hypothetical protein